MQPRLNIALKACRLASDLILKIYKSKDQDDLRSYSNIGALIYKHLIEIINESYPLGVDDFLGPTHINSESIDKKYNVTDLNIEDKFVWIINPLDSYENFYNKLPLFNTTITIFRNSVAEAALIYNPVEDTLITSIKGEGALFENRKIRNRSKSQEKILYVIDDKKIQYNLENIILGKPRFIGSKSTELVYLAEGKLDLVIYPNIDIWDSAAGSMICKESGLIVTALNGKDEVLNYKSMISAKDWLHQKILHELN